MPAQKVLGFTLVELLVVISIIAILSVIGITVFSGVQKNARDAKRRGDIDAISKAIELHFNTTSDQYCTIDPPTPDIYIYCTPADAWFAGGALPVDPNIKGPLSGSIDTGDSADLGYIYISLMPFGGRASQTYTVCADLEGVGTWTGREQNYCRSNQQ